MHRVLLIIVLALLLSGCREIVEKEADEKFAIAEAALHEKQWAEANESFHETILLDPERADAWIGRGMTLTHLGEPDEARLHYEEALTLSRKRQAAEPAALNPVRHQIMLLVLLNRADEAVALATEKAKTHAHSEAAAQLPVLVETVQREFKDMILPPDQRTDRSLEYPKELRRLD